MSALCQQYRAASRLGRCTQQSAFRYTWPGEREAFICKTCVHRLRNVAAAMGFTLDIVPLDSEAPAPDTLPAPPNFDLGGSELAFHPSKIAVESGPTFEEMLAGGGGK